MACVAGKYVQRDQKLEQIPFSGWRKNLKHLEMLRVYVDTQIHLRQQPKKPPFLNPKGSEYHHGIRKAETIYRTMNPIELCHRKKDKRSLELL